MHASRHPREHDALDNLRAEFERLTALVFLINGRLAALEDRSDVSASSFDPMVTTIKDAAQMTGYSESGIRKLIAVRRIVARRVGGRWLIEVASLPRRCD